MKATAESFWYVLLIASVCLVTWLFARPASIFAEFTEQSVTREETSPDCERTRVSLEELLGKRWRPLSKSCLQGSCPELRDALASAGFSPKTWSLRLPDDKNECLVNGDQLSSGCTVLRTRLDADPPLVWLQFAGSCKESQ